MPVLSPSTSLRTGLLKGLIYYLNHELLELHEEVFPFDIWI